jgi:hypothetical protein
MAVAELGGGRSSTARVQRSKELELDYVSYSTSNLTPMSQGIDKIYHLILSF